VPPFWYTAIMGLLIRNARVLTMGKGSRPRRGESLGQLGVVPRTDVIVMGDKIAAVGASLSMPPNVKIIEAGGRVLMPAFIDCHTHACWAGDRLQEWDLSRRGASYLEIMRAGGGIMSTVKAVREAPAEALADILRARLKVMLREGTTTVEVKTGYGLSTRDEVKMLRAIQEAASDWPGTVVPTALIGHAIDPEQADFVERTIRETLPAIHEEFPGVAIDVYVERGAWSVAEAVKLLEAAAQLDHPFRVHADQFNSMGMLAEAVRLGAQSVDHLEASSPEDLKQLAESDTIGVVLPCSGFHAEGTPTGREGRDREARYADARALVDAGGALAIATNCNPGSSPCSNMPMAIAVGVRRCGLTPAEAIGACTINAGAVLGLSDRGTVAPGQRADLVLLRHRDERELAHEFGGNPIDTVIVGGRIV